MAVIVHRILALAADGKDTCSGFDDGVSDCLELVYSHHDTASAPTCHNNSRPHRLRYLE